MAAVNFPNPAATNPDTNAPYRDGWYNPDNGVTYIYVDAENAWKAATVNNANFDDIYVNEVGGDHMQGPLTIGLDTEASNSTITLAADGSATFAGDVSANRFETGSYNDPSFAGGVRITSASVNVDRPQATASNTALAVRTTGANTFTVSGEGNVRIGGDIAGDDPNIRLTPSGSAAFANGNVEINSTGLVNSYRNTTTSTQNALFQIGVNDGGTKTNQFSFKANGELKIGGDTSSGGNANILLDGSNGSAEFAGGDISLNADGSATFAGDVEIYKRSSTPSVPILIGYSNVGSTKKRQFVISASGSATFEGPLAHNGSTPVLAADSAVLWTEPDNPANYTTTTDSEGNETQVYNGPTLDVKESIQTAQAARDAMRETFQELQVAVANATDFSSLKAAMMVALEDYA